MFKEKLDSRYSMAAIARAFQEREGVVFLDSNSTDYHLGAYSLLGFDPFIRFTATKDRVRIERDGSAVETRTHPLEALERLLGEFPVQRESDLPFSGGAMGYFSYDFKNQLEDLPQRALDDRHIEDLQFYFYHGAVVENRTSREIFYTDYDFDGGALDRYRGLLEHLSAFIPGPLAPFRLEEELAGNFKRLDYLQAIASIKEYIRQGEIYQANMTQRFGARFKGEPFELYERLRRENPAPFSAFARMGDTLILSSSPERLIEVRDSTITTRPIKGTVPRGETPEEDESMKRTLLASEKDRAELLMIVDLERNDLGRICQPGTVAVPELFKIETYATVHHLVATVTGRLRETAGIRKIIEGVFPGGSITGAPKIRAMEIIDELEPTRRNIYTGSLGYIDFSGDMDLNILIRTLVAREGRVQFQVGGGIVWDSIEAAEYQETLDKGKSLFKVLNEVDQP
ncbi:MAG: hypothetical protein AVO33_08225 [delta proteobacterium ML8_F1]|nr:MAG: hypothetical protein AVO33_08225 [delta proteobacterium ML8_F1]